MNEEKVKLFREKVVGEMANRYSANGLPISSGTEHQILIMATSTAIQVALSLIPGMDVIFAAFMIANMIDPYDYNNTYTRSGIDGMASQMIQSITTSLQNQLPTLTPKVYQQLLPTIPTLTEAQVQQMLLQSIGFWTIVQSPQVQTQCYGDYATQNTLSGTPGPGCNTLYTEYYNQYYDTNHDAYLQGNYAASEAIFNNLISSNINVYRSNVFKVTAVIAFGLIGLFFIVFFVRKWIVKRSG